MAQLSRPKRSIFYGFTGGDKKQPCKIANSRIVGFFWLVTWWLVCIPWLSMSEGILETSECGRLNDVRFVAVFTIENAKLD